jgi:hypothetical protein
MWRMFRHDQPACATVRAGADDRLGRGKGDTMEYLGTPFAWSVFAVIAIAVAAAMITYAIRKKDETVPSFGEVSGTLKQDWTRAGKIDFHVAALESTSPQQLILRVGEKRIIENSMGEDVIQLRWRFATMEEAKEVVVCWNTFGSQNRPS